MKVQHNSSYLLYSPEIRENADRNRESISSVVDPGTAAISRQPPLLGSQTAKTAVTISLPIDTKLLILKSAAADSLTVYSNLVILDHRQGKIVFIYNYSSV